MTEHSKARKTSEERRDTLPFSHSPIRIEPPHTTAIWKEHMLRERERDRVPRIKTGRAAQGEQRVCQRMGSVGKGAFRMNWHVLPESTGKK